MLSIPGITLNAPTGVAIDGVGNLYIADSGNGRVVELSAQGVASVLNANSLELSANYGVAVDGQGNVYTSDATNNRVLVFPPFGSAYVLGTTGVTLGSAYGVAADGSGNVFIADYTNSRIVKVKNGAATVLSTGALSPALASPQAVAVDAVGNVYISDSANNRVVEISAGTTNAVVLDTGALTLSLPNGVAVGNNGGVLISDSGNNRIVDVSLETSPALTFATPTSIGTADGPDDPQSFTLLNLGNQALTIASANFATTTPTTGTSFAKDGSSTCVTSLAANNKCVYGVNFTPAASGSNIGSLTLTDNTLGVIGSTQAVALNGTGVVPLTGFTISAYPSTVQAGIGLSFTVTAMNGSTVATGYTGTVNFTSSDAQASFSPSSYTFTGGDAGVHTFTLGVFLHTVGNQTITATDSSAEISQASSNIQVTVGSAAIITASAGSGQSAFIGAAFTSPLGILVTDAWGNPVGGITVNYIAPASGASATLSSNGTVVTANDGTASLSATANGTAGAYTVTTSSPSVSPAARKGPRAAISVRPDGAAPTSAKFNLTNSVATPAVALRPLPASPIAYGQAQTSLAATVTYSAGTPTGSITFSDGSAQLGSAVSLSSGAATFAAQYYAAGTHSFVAAYSGDTNYNAASSSTSTYAVNKAASTLTGPATQPVSVVYQNAGAIAVSVTGQYSGAGIAAPTGNVSYTIALGSTQISSGQLTISSGAVSVPVANTLASGVYTVALSYNGDSNYNSATSINVSLQVGKIQPTINWTQPSAIVYGTTLNGLLNAVAMNASATVPGTYAFTATPAGGLASAVSNTSMLPAGTYTLSVLFTPTDATAYKTATGNVSLTVNKAAPGDVLTSNANPVLVQDPITLTATVSSSASTPTGTVTFLDGTTPIGTGTVSSSGVATLSLSTLAVGSHSITSVYSGDANFATSTSSALTQLVQDFDLTISASGGTTGITSLTVLPGGTAVYTFTLSPAAPATSFPAVVTLSASGLPTGATYTFSPATLAVGSGSTQVTLTISLPRGSAANQAPVLQQTEVPVEVAQNKPASKLPFLALALLLLPCAGGMRRASRKLGRMLPLLLLLVASLAALASMSGCGGTASGYFGQAPANYTITVTGTAGALSHNTSVTLTVE